MKNGKLHGTGKKTYADGTIYEGVFQNGYLDGSGKVIRQNCTEEGTFFKDQLHGRGKITYSDGVVEEGDYENGIFTKGFITYPNQKVFEGELKQGVLCGKWIENGIVTVPQLEGLKDALISGDGKLKVTLPSGTVAEGEFKDWKLHHGKKTHHSGNIEEGEFDGTDLIEGTLTQKDGTIVSGKWKGDLFEGKVKHVDGTTDEGFFEDGKFRAGPVKITLPDGTVYEGDFKDWEIAGRSRILTGMSKKGDLNFFK